MINQSTPISKTKRTGCSQLTRQGRTCKNPAMAGSEPPSCRRHYQPVKAITEPVESIYFSGLSVEEQKIWETYTHPQDLSAEIGLVRIILRRLINRLNDPSFVILPEDLRQLTGLIFSGVRTVAQLQSQQASRQGGAQNWMAEALEILSKEFDFQI